MLSVTSPLTLLFVFLPKQRAPIKLILRILATVYPDPPHLPLGGEPFLADSIGKTNLEEAVASMTDKTLFTNLFNCNIHDYLAKRGKQGATGITVRILKYLKIPFDTKKASTKRKSAGSDPAPPRPTMYSIPDKKWQDLLHLGILALPVFRDVINDAELDLDVV